MTNSESPRPSDGWAKSPLALLESYVDANFKGDKLARDESIEFLAGELQLKAFLVAVATLSNDTKAFDSALQGKKLSFFYPTSNCIQFPDQEHEYFKELQARLKVLTFMQIAVIHKNLNIPNRDSYREFVEQTQDNLFETALALGEESTIRILAKQLFERSESDDTKKALLLRLQSLYPKSEQVAETILDLLAREHFDCGDSLDLLEEFYPATCDFERVVVTEVLANFEAFLPRNFNDLDQAMLLRFLAERMYLEHKDEIYERFFKLDITGDESLECIILDRLAVLACEKAAEAATSLTSKFHEQLSQTDTFPSDWGLSQ